MQHVPYNGAGPAVTDLLGGSIPLGFTAVPPVAPHIKAGRLKAIAVTTRFQRNRTGVSLMSEAKWLGTSYPSPDALSSEQLEKMRLTGQTREQYETMVRERALRDRAAPKVGERAPDFEIERLTLAGKRTGEIFRLSSTRGKPVALVFGSYT